jgi:TonB family protein
MRFIARSLLLLVAFSGLDEPTRQPLAVHVESLAYPDLARQAQIQGAVDVEIEIDSQGKVSSASATSGHPLLKQPAEKNIRTWRFDTSSPDNLRRLKVRYEFILEPPKTYYRPESRNLFDLPARITVVSKLPEPQP